MNQSKLRQLLWEIQDTLGERDLPPQFRGNFSQIEILIQREDRYSLAAIFRATLHRLEKLKKDRPGVQYLIDKVHRAREEIETTFGLPSEGNRGDSSPFGLDFGPADLN